MNLKDIIYLIMEIELVKPSYNDMVIGVLNGINDLAKRTNSGNVSHNMSVIRGMSGRTIEFINKYGING